MFWFVLGLLVLAFCFSLFGLILYCITLNKKLDFSKDADTTILIPFRNEEKNLPGLIDSFRRLNSFDKSKILFIDDHSSDKSMSFLVENGFNVVRLNEKEMGKKEALKKGVNSVDAEYVLFNDADGIHEKDYGDVLNRVPEDDFDIIVLPIWIKNDMGLLNKMIQLDYAQLSFATFSFKGNLGSGANLLVKRESYLELSNSLRGEILSGDDYFLLKEARKRKMKILYVGDIKYRILTKGPSSLSELISQRGRWIQKSIKTSNGSELLISIGFLIYSALFPLLLAFCLLDFHNQWLYLILFKILVDLLVFIPSLIQNKALRLLYLLPLLEIIYPIYYLAVLLKAISKNKWKERDI